MVKVHRGKTITRIKGTAGNRYQSVISNSFLLVSVYIAAYIED